MEVQETGIHRLKWEFWSNKTASRVIKTRSAQASGGGGGSGGGWVGGGGLIDRLRVVEQRSGRTSAAAAEVGLKVPGVLA